MTKPSHRRFVIASITLLSLLIGSSSFAQNANDPGAQYRDLAASNRGLAADYRKRAQSWRDMAQKARARESDSNSAAMKQILADQIAQDEQEAAQATAEADRLEQKAREFDQKAQEASGNREVHGPTTPLGGSEANGGAVPAASPSNEVGGTVLPPPSIPPELNPPNEIHGPTLPLGGSVANGGAVPAPSVTPSAAAREFRGLAHWADGQGNCGENQGVGGAGNGTGYIADFRINASFIVEDDSVTFHFVSYKGSEFFGPVRGTIDTDSTFHAKARNEKYDEDYEYKGKLGHDKAMGTFTRRAHYVGTGNSAPRCTANWTVTINAGSEVALAPQGPTHPTTTTREKVPEAGTPLAAETEAPTPAPSPPYSETPAPMETATPVAKVPPPKEAFICGPDLTKNVENVMQQIVDAYDGWSKDDRAQRCGDLLSLSTAASAWDINPFFNWCNELAIDGSDGKKIVIRPALHKSIARNCCKPEWPCGCSIEFDGICIHAQVVNYAMWGVMNQLCDQNAAASVKHFAWTHAPKEIGGPGYGGAHYDEQVLMRELGQAFARTAATQPRSDNTYKSSSYEDQLAYGRAKDSLAAKMGKIKRDEEPCELKCKLTADEQGYIGKWQLDWHWADYHVLKDGTVKVFKLPPGYSNAPAKPPRR